MNEFLDKISEEKKASELKLLAEELNKPREVNEEFVTLFNSLKNKNG